MTAFNRLNHLLTRTDVWEKSPNAPIRRYIMPSTAGLLSYSVIKGDLQHTPKRDNKRKVLIRDSLAMVGVVLGIASGIMLAKSRLGALLAHYLSKILHREVDFHHMALSKGAKEYVKTKPWGKELLEHHHHHDHSSTTVLTKSPLGRRLANLFRTHSHDHGIPGILMLESMAAGSILGGIVGGSVADHLNQESLKQTLPAKLYESIFQFLGNITLCTVAILAGAWTGKAAAQQALKVSAIQNFTEKRLLRYLHKIQAPRAIDLRRVPTEFTEAFEEAWLKLRNNPNNTVARNQFHQELMEWVSNYYPPKTVQSKHLNTLIAKHLKQKDINSRTLRQHTYQYLSQQLQQELKPFKKASTLPDIKDQALRADLQIVAKHRLEKSWEQIGVITGFIAGIIGGAIASSKLNDYLAKTFHFEKPINQPTLFHARGHESGILKNTVGPRGIHWWDMVLHADDWPSAMYMAGVEMLEPIIRVLYGMSGYLSGVAGTSYSHGAKHVHYHDPNEVSIPPKLTSYPYQYLISPSPNQGTPLQIPPEKAFLQSS